MGFNGLKKALWTATISDLHRPVTVTQDYICLLRLPLLPYIKGNTRLIVNYA